MGRETYLANLREKLRELGFQIERIQSRLADSSDLNRRVDLRGQLRHLEMRRTELRAKLDGLADQPSPSWSNLRAELEEEWDNLVQDFEERVGRLA